MSDEKGAVQPTPDTFGLVVSAVFSIQQTLGEQIHTMQTLSENAAQQHRDLGEMRQAVSEMKALVKYGAVLLVALAGVSAWLFRQMWSLLIPFLQGKGHP